MMNNKGFTLVEVMIASVIAGIVMWGVFGSIRVAASWSSKLTKQTRSSALLLAELKKFKLNQARIVLVPRRKCVELVGGTFALNIGSRTVELFSDERCSNSLGTLDALKNETYFDVASATLWVVSGGFSDLKVIIVKIFIEGV